VIAPGLPGGGVLLAPSEASHGRRVGWPVAQVTPDVIHIAHPGGLPAQSGAILMMGK